MLDRRLLDEATLELQTPLRPSRAGEVAAVAAFVASSLRLEGIASTPRSVIEAVQSAAERPTASSR
jgi:hypothetical protein